MSYDNGQFNYVYNYVDHLGNVRLSYTDGDGNGSIDPSTEIIQEKNYYPFGLTHQGYNGGGSPYGNDAAKRYGFGGKELQDEIFSENTLEWYDFGARNYDSSIGRWHSTDNKAEFYFANSPFVYALNTPINAVDPDGNLVIFINGLGGGGASYWRNEGINFDKMVMTHFNDHNARYIDGSPAGLAHNISGETRYREGYNNGRRSAKQIIESLVRDPQGNISETIKIVSHSMGGVYGKGFVKALKEHIKNHKDPRVRKALISLVADFDPFQAGSKYGSADPNIFTHQFINSSFFDLLNFGFLANQEEEGADEVTNNENKSSHFIESFAGNIDDLQEGTYEWNEDKEEWDCTSCKND